MPKKETQYQTLSEFLQAPFGQRNLSRNSEYESKYQKFKSSNKIRVEGYTKMDDDCFIHIKVPSESQPGVEYDVVIQFFTDDPSVSKENTYENYYIKFFSNSPGFIYKYAVLYKIHGYLIESLYDKMDPEFINTLPEKTNKNLEINYDKSIYFACRFLSENKFGILNKLGILIRRKKSFEKFIQGISDFEESKLGLEIASLEKTIKSDTEKEKKKAKEARKEKLKNLFGSNKIRPSNSTLKDKDSSSIHKVDKIKSTKSTVKSLTSKPKKSNIRIGKKHASFTTKKK